MKNRDAVIRLARRVGFVGRALVLGTLLPFAVLRLLDISVGADLVFRYQGF